MELNGTIFLQVFIFLTLLVWLSGFLFSPILRLFDEREKRIVGAKKEASELSLLADEKSKAFDAAYVKARENARLTLSQLKSMQEKEQNESLLRVKAFAKERMEKAEHNLKLEEQEVRQALSSTTGTLADDIVRALLSETEKLGEVRWEVRTEV